MDRRPALAMYKHVFLTGPPGIGKTTLIQKVSESLKSSGLSAEGFFTEEVRQGGRRIGFDVVTLSGKRGTLSRIGSDSRTDRREYRVGQYVVDLVSFEHLALPVLTTYGVKGVHQDDLELYWDSKWILDGMHRTEYHNQLQVVDEAIETLNESFYLGSLVREDGGYITDFGIFAFNNERIGFLGIGPKSKQIYFLFYIHSLTVVKESGAHKTVCVIDEIGKMELFSESFIHAVRKTLDCAGAVILGTIPVSKGKPLPLVEEIKRRPDVKICTITKENRDGILQELVAAIHDCRI